MAIFDAAAQREIGPYAVHELIGWSGISRVYRATDSSREEAEVAIKVLSKSITSDEEYEQYFIREIEISGVLEHPHILTALGSGCEQGVLFMVMPLVRGGTLADDLRARCPLPLRQALILVEQIGSALDYIHSFRIVHRDIKPANILLRDENHYMLADFGLVMHVGDLTETVSDEVMGTLLYMSPEQVRGDALDHRSDLYSLGLVLYECLTGRVPYNIHSPVESMTCHVTTPPISPRQISPRFPACLDALLLHGIEKDRALRFQSGREMVDELYRASDRLGYEETNHPLVSQEEIKGSKYPVQ